MSTSEEKIKIKDDKISHLEAEVAKLRDALKWVDESFHSFGWTSGDEMVKAVREALK